MTFVIKTNVLLNDEDMLLDMEIELWELEYELDMPIWYWVTNKAIIHQIAKIKVLQNKIKSIKNKLSKSVEYD